MRKAWTWLFEHDAADRRLPARAWVALALLALAAMAPGLTNIPVLDRDEARYAQASRQMMETGDYVDIRFQEAPRHVKPVGIYWMQVATTAPFGGKEAPIWAHRLPSLLGALGAVLLTAWLGTKMAGARIGFAAGTLMAVSLAVVVEARIAKTDAMLLLTILAAMTALWFVANGRARPPGHPPDELPPFFWAPFAFWAASGLSLMVKGPIVTLVTFSAILVLSLWRRNWRWILDLRILPGLAVLAAVALPWVVMITVQSNGGFIEDSIGHALLGKVAKDDDSHGAPPGYHTLFFFLTFWPGAILLGLAGVYAWMKRRDPDVQFLVSWILPTWIVFELVVTKLPHYVMPVFPAVALLFALALRDAGEVLTAKRGRWIVWGVAVPAVLLGFAVVALPSVATAQLLGAVTPVAAVASLAAALTVAAAVFLLARPALHRLPLLALPGAAFYVLMFGAVIPSLDPLFPSKALAEEVARLEGCDRIEVATAGYREPSNVFYLGTETVLTQADGAVAHLTTHPRCGLAAVDRRRSEAFLAGADAAGLTLRQVGAVEGINVTKGRELDMRLYVLDASPLRPALRTADAGGAGTEPRAR